jgi:type I restriction enzyme S subunit
MGEAFFVMYRNLRAFSVGSFVSVDWKWDKRYIQPLSNALSRKVREVDRKQTSLNDLQLATIHFDGSIEPRRLSGKNSFKGKLFYAHSGDVVYSKIDVRNGAIGIIPPDMLQVAVSSEYPVYAVNTESADANFIHLIFRTAAFQRILNSMISGASGRKRVQPSQIETVEIPLPPLDAQRSVVARWQEAQQAALTADEMIYQAENNVPRMVLETLGIPYYENKILPKVFSCFWSSLDNFGVGYTARAISSSKDLHESIFPLKQLGDISRVSYGIQKSPANRPGKNARPYLRVANVQKGQLNLSEIKYIDVADAEMEALRLQKGDLLVCEGNSADLVGRPAIWNNEIPYCVHQNHILKVRINSDVALPEYILEYMQTLPARTYFRSRAKFTTHLASINSNDLRELPVPLPPLDVQQSIVQKTQSARAEISRQRQRAAQIRREAEAEVEEMILGTKQV